MLVWLASMRPETRWLLWTYGLLRLNATWMLVGPHGMNCANLRSRIRCSDLCTCVGSTSPWNHREFFIFSMIFSYVTFFTWHFFLCKLSMNNYICRHIFYMQIMYFCLMRQDLNSPEWYSRWKCNSGDLFYPNQLRPSYSLAAKGVSLHLILLFYERSLFAEKRKQSELSWIWGKNNF